MPGSKRESGAPSATQRPHPQAAQAIAAEELGPLALGLAVPTLSLHPESNPHCQALDRNQLAPPRLQAYWCWKSRPGAGQPPIDGGIREPDPTDKHGQPNVGCTPHSRRTAHARHRDGAVDRGKTHGAEVSTTTVTELEDLRAQHAAGIASIDLCVVPTAFFKLFYAPDHQRRRLIGFGVTAHPTAEWIALSNII